MDNKKTLDECDNIYEYHKQFSSYHFDHRLQNNCDEGMLKYITTLDTDWEDEIATLTNDGLLGEWDELRQKSEDWYQKNGTSLSNAFNTSQINNVDHPKLWKTAESIGLANWYARVHIQKPGQVVTYHLDKASVGTEGENTYLNKKNKHRLFIFLDDWYPGQFFTIAQTTIYWQKGDVVWFSWRDAPHATANAGQRDRPVMVITGIETDNFLEFANLHAEKKT